MPDRDYKTVKDFFLSGRVFLAKKTVGVRADQEKIYEIRWGYTQFQGKRYVHLVNEDTVLRGVRNFEILSGGVLSNASWRSMCSASPGDDWDASKSLDDYEVWTGSLRNFETRQILPETLEDVEMLKNMDFQASRQIQDPTDLFTMDDGETKTRLRAEHKERFKRSASSCFLAYMPVSFWKKVVTESNAYAADEKAAAITLHEMMKFLGILFYMTVVIQGEYSAYWGDQPGAKILPGSVGLEGVMSLKRFQFIRKVLCFRNDVTIEDLKSDPAARIRPLMNMLKHTSPRYVEVGRDVAVDESSIACRSKYGRHLIVFNSSKPTGKFHFKIYTCCCSTSWLMVGFRLHCSSTMKARLCGVMTDKSLSEVEERLQFSSEIRRHALEVTQSLHGTKRIVNTDNFYTSVQLLLSLKEVGLYGRGTVRENSKHFPKVHMFSKRSGEERGAIMQGVSSSGKMVAASWMDGNAVNIISNAEASTQTEVRRRVGQTSQVYPAPKCIAEYNQNMQGVDRMDQLRAHFSLADGHSFQKWHKKLAMAFIDIARCNAYVTRCLAMGEEVTTARSPHRDFVMALHNELISGEWADSCEEDGMFFDNPHGEKGQVLLSPVVNPSRPSRSPGSPACEFVLSKNRFPNATRGKRGCKVCKFEGRYETEKTNYCVTHKVCLCTQVYARSERYAGVVCPFDDWTCWRKFHEYYLPRGLFNSSGHVKRASILNKAKRQLMLFEEVAELSRTPVLPPPPSLSTAEVDIIDDPTAELDVVDGPNAAPQITYSTPGETTALECYPATPSYSIASTTPSSVFV